MWLSLWRPTLRTRPFVKTVPGGHLNTPFSSSPCIRAETHESGKGFILLPSRTQRGKTGVRWREIVGTGKKYGPKAGFAATVGRHRHPIGKCSSFFWNRGAARDEAMVFSTQRAVVKSSPGLGVVRAPKRTVYQGIAVPIAIRARYAECERFACFVCFITFQNNNEARTHRVPVPFRSVFQMGSRYTRYGLYRVPVSYTHLTLPTIYSV